MKRLGVTLCIFCLFPVTVFAGSFVPPATPDATASAMYTVEDLYQRLLNGADGTKRGAGFQEPAAAPGATMHDLNEIMATAPVRDDLSGATVDQVLSGQTFWGLTGDQWGLQTGTRVDPYVGPQSVAALVDTSYSYVTAVTLPADGARPTSGGWSITLNGHFVAKDPASAPDAPPIDLTCEAASMAIDVEGIAVPCTDVLSLTSDELVFQAPAGTGTGQSLSVTILSVVTPAIIGAVAADGTYTYHATNLPGIDYDPPTITEIRGCVEFGSTTTQCSISGATVTIKGDNFGSDSLLVGVTVDGLACDIISLDVLTATTSLLQCNILAPDYFGASEPVVVTVNGQASAPFAMGFAGSELTGGTLCISDEFPTCQSGLGDISPDSSAEYTFKLTGTALSGITAVRFGPGGTAWTDLAPVASYTAESDTGLQATVAAGDAVGVIVFGIQAGQQVFIGTDTVTYPAPSISSGSIRTTLESPGLTSVLGTSSHGEWLYFDVQNQGDDPDRLTVTFGPSGGPYLQQCTQVEFPDPTNYPGTVRYFTGAGTGSALVFVVQVLNRTSPAGTDTFSYPVAPTGTAVSGCSDSGDTTLDCPTGGGITLTLTGSGFGGEPADIDLHVGVARALVQSVSDTAIAFTLPPGSGTQAVTVRRGNLLDEVNRATLSYLAAAPTLSAVSGCTDQGVTTLACPQAGGTTITLRGSELGAAGGVVFVKDQYAGSVTHAVGDPQMEIRFTLPAGSGWNVPVRFVDGSGTASNAMKLSYAP